MDIGDPPLQLLWVLGEELELGAVALGVFPGVVVADFSWKTGEKEEEEEEFFKSA